MDIKIIKIIQKIKIYIKPIYWIILKTNVFFLNFHLLIKNKTAIII
jgi:hypothetical protein